MSRCKHLRIRDVRAVDHLVGECLEQWHDADSWRVHLLQHASALLHYPVSLLCEINTLDVGITVQLRSAMEQGWATESDRQTFATATRPAEPNQLFSVSPLDIRFRERFSGRTALTTSRSDLIDDGQWHHADAYVHGHRPTRMDEMLYSAVRLPHCHGVSLMAFGGPEAPRDSRQRGILALLHRCIATHYGRRLTTSRQAGRHKLHPRQREVLDLLIQGLDEKTIAARLFRTRSTINGHVAAIYQAFGVRSRAELLAQQIARQPIEPN